MRGRGVAIAVAVVALVAIGTVVVSIVAFGGRTLAIDYYRETDPDEITIGVTSGERAWTRLTSVEEDADSITITVHAWDWPIPGTDVGFPVELVVGLKEPLAGRTVRNAEGGAEVVQTTCNPPIWDAPECIQD
jgi:hypothetical protein